MVMRLRSKYIYFGRLARKANPEELNSTACFLFDFAEDKFAHHLVSAEVFYEKRGAGFEKSAQNIRAVFSNSHVENSQFKAIQCQLENLILLRELKLAERLEMVGNAYSFIRENRRDRS